MKSTAHIVRQSREGLRSIVLLQQSLSLAPQDPNSDRTQHLPKWERRYNSDSNAESPWSHKVILSVGKSAPSIDISMRRWYQWMLKVLHRPEGGGVKGYSSLLILEALMREDIRSIERRIGPKYESRMSCPWSNR